MWLLYSKFVFKFHHTDGNVHNTYTLGPYERTHLKKTLPLQAPLKTALVVLEIDKVTTDVSLLMEMLFTIESTKPLNSWNKSKNSWNKSRKNGVLVPI
jgi:hypothetical protein